MPAQYDILFASGLIACRFVVSGSALRSLRRVRLYDHDLMTFRGSLRFWENGGQEKKKSLRNRIGIVLPPLKLNQANELPRQCRCRVLM